MDPLDEYVTRRDRWRAREQRLARQFIQLGNMKLVTAIVASVLMFFAVGQQTIRVWWLLPAVVALAVLIGWHKSVAAHRTRAERAIRFYERGIARLQNDWIGKGTAGEQFRDPGHVYTEDLDVFGRGSLFELIATTRTVGGEKALADWLRAPAARDEALSRQEAVRELSGQLDFREEIALIGAEIRGRVHEKSLQAWGAAPGFGFSGVLRLAAVLLAVLALASLVAFFSQQLPRAVFVAVLACNFAVAFALRPRVRRVLEGADTPGHELGTFSRILEVLERKEFQSPRLRQIRAAMTVEGSPASKRIAHLQRWVDLLDSSDHLLIRLIRPAVLWREQIAMGIQHWRLRNGRYVVAWVRAVAEFEALSSFASLKFERPEWTFPALLDGDAHFEARDLQHPLLPTATCVPNDVTISGDLRLLIVSGSNMSGKSTLLRSVGLNAVLAWAGGPVAAQELRISPLHVGASVRVVDSLQDNKSRFFAEITRIRGIVELAHSRQVLFLLDELLSGTNSHDRRIGASGVVRALVNAGAIGLITTHDLALAEIERDLQPAAAANVHFDDQILAGRIEFDYRLRPGVVTHSNALELMRTIGLQV
jgi:hypothetical protein